jgi:hypothetical protein
MAAPTLIKIQSATFKGKAITGAQQASIEFAGSEQTARGDGAVAAQISYVEDIKGKVSVTALAAQIKDTDHILPGNGALVIVGFTQAAGSGAVGGGAATWTFPNATLSSTNRGVPQDGNPTIAMQFTAVAASGLPTDIFSVT